MGREARVFQPLHHLHDDVRAASAPLPIWSYHQTTCDKCQVGQAGGLDVPVWLWLLWSWLGLWLGAYCSICCGGGGCQADVLDGVKSAYVQRCGGCPAVAHAVQKCAGQNAASTGLWFCRACTER